MSDFSATIPISVKPRTQRTLKVMAYGIKAFLTTKVPGKLIIRRKRNKLDVHYTEHTPWKETPPTFVPEAPDVPPEPEPDPPIFPTIFVEETHQDLLSRAITVKDFAYPATRVGRLNPVVPCPFALTTEEAENLGEENAKQHPSCPEEAPMPSISTTWTAPHPALAPVPAPKRVAVVEVPTLEKPYCPIYATHRIPSAFEVVDAWQWVCYRLQESPRTVPIHGLYTRRLLTISPNLIDLSQYHEMDLEELRRYDRCIAWQLMNGIEPYPWYTSISKKWLKQGIRSLSLPPMFPTKRKADTQRQDIVNQYNMLWWADRKTREDNMWFHQRITELRLENERNGRVPGVRQAGDVSFFDLIAPDMGVSWRQYLRTWERRRDSAKPLPDYELMAGRLDELREEDVMRGLTPPTPDDMDPVDPYAGVTPPFTLGQSEFFVPLGAYWGPDAVWDGYRLRGGVPTGKTINEYAAELSSCVAVDVDMEEDSEMDAVAELVSSPKRKFEEVDGSSGDDSSSEEESEEEPDVEEGPSRKRTRTV
ncbi:hypothetical protein DFH06DRAFT_1171662 [Mycena polygramma]|nr:hypothetical protein DFH06DRAFT_1171662 [Mycena polygramma]